MQVARRNLRLACFGASSGILHEEHTWLGERHGTWDEDIKVQMKGSRPSWGWLGAEHFPSMCTAPGLIPNTADQNEIKKQ